MPDSFDEATLVITGGTGSFGNALIEKIIDSNIKEIRVLSRDEKKQDDMRKKFQNKKLKFYLGDVRDAASLDACFQGATYLFHAAALKQVPSSEFFPLEAIKTNSLGSGNVIDKAVDAGIYKIICLSTDKAVNPINAMGMTKALMEKIALAKAKSIDENRTQICITRYGNVIASRGSVIPLFKNQVLTKKPITVTDPKMTRFMMSLDDAIDLVLYALNNGDNGSIYVQKSPAANTMTIANAVRNLLKAPDHPIDLIGTRHGEKVNETLISPEEMVSAQDHGRYFSISRDNRDLNYDSYYSIGNENLNSVNGYTSGNTEQLSVEKLTEILSKLDIKNGE